MSRVPRARAVLACALACALAVAGCAGCGGSASPAPERPATVAHAVKEADLTTVTLSADAERRLGIATAVLGAAEVGDERELGGELLVPPGRSVAVSAAVAGQVAAVDGVRLSAGARVERNQVVLRLTPFAAPPRDLRVTYEADLAAAAARLDAAQRQLARSRQLLQDEVGSQRSVEQAEQEFAQASAVHAAAAARMERLRDRPLEADVSVPVSSPFDGVVRQLQTAPGQIVSAGTVLFEVVDLRRLWVRVPVYVGDVADLARARQATVRALGARAAGPGRVAGRISGPPTADPQASSADLFFEVDNADLAFGPGQKVAVLIPSGGGAASGLVVPASAVAYDYQGGAWVYVNSAPRVYARQRVEVARTVGNNVVLIRGPAAGTHVVTAGVAELFGTEFGAGK